MTPEQAIALIGALTALVTAVSAAVYQLARLRGDLNGRMSQLIDAAAAASHKQGEMEGRDFMQRLLTQEDTPLEAPKNPASPPSTAASHS